MECRKSFRAVFIKYLHALLLVFVLSLLPADIVSAGSWIQDDDGYEQLYNGGINNDAGQNADPNNNSYSGSVEKGDDPTKDDVIGKLFANLIGLISIGIHNGLEGGETSADSVSFSIDGIILGRLRGAPISYTTFELADGNIYGYLASIVYVVLGQVARAMVFFSFLLLLVKNLFKGPKEGRVELKGIISSSVLAFLMIYLFPHLVDIVIFFKDYVLNLLRIALTNSNASGAGILSTYFNFYKDNAGILSSILYLAVCLSSLFFLGSYIKLAGVQTVLFGIFPAVATLSIWNKKMISNYCSQFFSNMFIPVIDFILFLLPSMILKEIYHTHPFASGIIVVFMVTGIMATRSVIMQIFGGFSGLQVAQGGGGLASLAIMAASMYARRSRGSREGNAERSGESSERVDKNNAEKNEELSDSLSEGGTTLESHRKDLEEYDSYDTAPEYEKEEDMDQIQKMDSSYRGDREDDIVSQDSREILNNEKMGREYLESEREETATESPSGEKGTELSHSTHFQSGNEYSNGKKDDTDKRADVPNEVDMEMPTSQKAGSKDIVSGKDGSAVLPKDDSVLDGKKKSKNNKTRQGRKLVPEGRLDDFSALRRDNLDKMNRAMARKEMFLENGQVLKDKINSINASMEEKRSSISKMENEAQYKEEKGSINEAITMRENVAQGQREYEIMQKQKENYESQLHENNDMVHVTDREINTRKEVEKSMVDTARAIGQDTHVFNSAEEFDRQQQIKDIQKRHINYTNFDSRQNIGLLSPEERAKYYRQRAMHNGRVVKGGKSALRKAGFVAGGIAGGTILGGAMMFGGDKMMLAGTVVGAGIGGKAGEKFSNSTAGRLYEHSAVKVMSVPSHRSSSPGKRTAERNTIHTESTPVTSRNNSSLAKDTQHTYNDTPYVTEIESLALAEREVIQRNRIDEENTSTEEV